MIRGEGDGERRPLASDAEQRLPGPLSEVDLGAANTVDLARALVERAQLLVRSEIALAREEIRADVRHGVTAGGLAGSSGVCFVAALCCGLIAAVGAIGRVALSPEWIGIIGAGMFAFFGLGLGLVAASEGRSARPARTLRQAHRTVDFLRQTVRP